ncbi:(2Fe-2S)-binding protein [Nonomuraea cavernae]|uniref:(2Fe-2S)-binding protein n=1 Tax=Nonomuraea cavernae TaxID=2045107 RepID=A0A917YZJ1_9ACTN|nr:(2Fe-2S)-binding protein [Nonomuraea cavernae]MCA2186127.1 (2Fe-2S)-binding protein [Nonomuraea cavernae]GGO70132.1 (2Fe-2S)-binding protein [Nonomuraea cavernae]
MTELFVNGEPRRVHADPMTPLSGVLREELHLRGTKAACGEGFCGSCTVFVDDDAVASCLVPVGLAEGRSVRTVESLADPAGALSPLQQAMKDNDAVQCGMCFPGMLMSLTALLETNPSPERRDVHEALVGNICRCTGYERIVDAALTAARAAGAAVEEDAS